MWEVIRLPDGDTHAVQGGKLAEDVAEEIASKQVEWKLWVEKVFVLGKIFPFLLQEGDYSKMVIENEYNRNPDALRDHSGEWLLEKVANENNKPIDIAS